MKNHMKLRILLRKRILYLLKIDWIFINLYQNYETVTESSFTCNYIKL